MGWTKENLGRMLAALALLVVVFVVGPAFDQVTCVPEQTVAQAQAFDTADAVDHTDLSSDHGLCAHGHCHHNVSFRDVPLAGFPAGLAIRADQQLPVEDMRASFTPDGLKRPPRG